MTDSSRLDEVARRWQFDSGVDTQAYWRHGSSNELWAVSLHDEAVVAAYGPLAESDTSAALLRQFPYSKRLGAWVTRNRQQFRPTETDASTTGHGDPIGRALVDGDRCLRCIALSNGVSLRRVAEELRNRVPTSDILIGEGQCVACAEHRALFRVIAMSESPQSEAAVTVS